MGNNTKFWKKKLSKILFENVKVDSFRSEHFIALFLE